MKKIMIILLTILLAPIVVSADGWTPVIIRYDGIVIEDNVPYYEEHCDTSKSFSKCEYIYEKVGVAKYNTPVIIIGENDVNGQKYYEVVFDPKNISDDGVGESEFIDSRYVAITSKIYDPKEHNEYEISSKGIAFRELEVKAGPASGYETVATMNPGEILRFDYIISGNNTWYYVSNNEKSGWVESKNRNLGVYGTAKDEEAIGDNAPIVDVDGNKIGTIPGGTIVKPQYYADEDDYYYSHKYAQDMDCIYITYQGISGFVSSEYLAIKYKDDRTSYYDLILPKKTNIYNKPGGTTVVGTFPIGKTIYEPKYRYEKNDISYLYIDHGDGKGWISTEDVAFDPKEYVLTTDIEASYADTGQVTTIHAEARIKLTEVRNADFENTYFIIYNNTYYYYIHNYIGGMIDDFAILSDDYSKQKSYKVDHDTKMYNSLKEVINGKNKNPYFDIVIPKNTVVEVVSTEKKDGLEYYKVIYRHTEGWIALDEGKKEKDSDVIVAKKKGLSSKEKIIICVGVGVALSVTALVIIILVNKKKKSKKKVQEQAKENEIKIEDVSDENQNNSISTPKNDVEKNETSTENNEVTINETNPLENSEEAPTIEIEKTEEEVVSQDNNENQEN